jgi:hypothetical protein
MYIRIAMNRMNASKTMKFVFRSEKKGPVAAMAGDAKTVNNGIIR